MLGAALRTQVGSSSTLKSVPRKSNSTASNRPRSRSRVRAAPREQVVGRHRVHDLVGRHAALRGAVGAVGLPFELVGRVRVGADRDAQPASTALVENPLRAGRGARAGS